VNDQSAYLEKIIAQMVNYSQLNFEESLDIIEDPEMDELVPGLAVGVNILGEELQHKVKELKSLNDELIGKNSFIKSVTDAVPEVIFVFNLQQQKITYVNKCTSSNPESPCTEIAIQKSEACENCTLANTILEQQRGVSPEEINGNEIKIISLNQEIKWYKITANDFEKDSLSTVTSILQTVSDITLLKEKELQLLKKEEAIIQSLKEKELLLQEVHHRVKNNLQIISGLLTLQINRAKSEEVINQLAEIRSRILSISMIHEELYQSETFSRIDISKYCIRLCKNLAPVYSNGNVDILFDFDIEPNIFWGIEKATSLGLIINEVICNSYKHAFTNEKNGIISVKLKSTDHHYVMEIKDNGKNPIVMDVAISGKKTLGGKLISGLIMQLEASLKITTDLGYGVEISIPKEL
jgi:two-component sensor histidine kinase